ncbi:DUF2510 domain-containing protein [Salinibacterium sp. M195]|uniref:DUF2510 domain-containing protein n=1 Tax=Salinibacterium sp. M195 TaxID=2583374 RepID=UPI001C62588C|nr:DUF2510 domain-containing protein [Salinibacterium sp. M195]
MSDSTTPLPSAGWYADPAGGPTPRWWDGTAWAAPEGASPSSSSTPTSSPAASTNTWQIFVLAAMPILSIIGLFFLDVSAFFPSYGEGALEAQLRIYTDPGYLAIMVTGWLVFLASIPLSIFDRKTLIARGVDRPFHWAFVFLGSFWYTIGRSIVVYIRTRQGLGPLWIAVVVQTVGLIGAFTLLANMMTLMMRLF